MLGKINFLYLCNMEMNMQLKTGDILHCTGHSLLSKIIRWFTKSKINHTGIVVEVWDQVYVIDAQKNGVNPKPLEAWLKEYNYDVIISRPGDINVREFCIKAFSKVGLTGYDFENLIIKHPLSIVRGKWVKDKDPNDDKMICSEYVAWVFDIDKPYRITPAKLYEYCKRKKFTESKLVYNV